MNCGLQSLDETNTEVGTITSSSYIVNNNSSMSVFALMNFSLAGCSGGCTGAAPAGSGDIGDFLP